MNAFALFLIIAVFFIVLEGVFLLSCSRWLSSGKRQREKDFARLDAERQQLFELQAAVAQDMELVKKMSDETLTKLNILGAEVHSEWTEVSARLQALSAEVDASTRALLDEKLTEVASHRLALEKACQQATGLSAELGETQAKAKRLLRFFEKNVPADEIVKDLQTEKYAEARALLSSGVAASDISRKLGLSMSEVALLSHIR